MKPTAFDYERPAGIAEALRLLAAPGISSKVVAGSQSLGPMLNLRLAQPDLLVDVTAIPELRGVVEGPEHVQIGACVTHADIEDGRVPDPSRGLLPLVARRIAYRAVRNRGTVGGSLAHADPAADWVSVLPLLGAEVVAHSSESERIIPSEKLMVSSFVTNLKMDEIITGVRIPRLSPRARWGFYKFNRKAGEFAHALAGVVNDPETGRFRAVLGAIETAPIVISDATRLFGGSYRTDLAAKLDRKAVEALLDERGVEDDYTRQLAVVALRRAAQGCEGS